MKKLTKRRLITTALAWTGYMIFSQGSVLWSLYLVGGWEYVRATVLDVTTWYGFETLLIAFSSALALLTVSWLSRDVERARETNSPAL